MSALVQRIAKNLLAGALFVLAVESYFHLSLTYFIDGVVLGSLYGITGVALILIYRTNRIINFAAAAVGAVPAILALSLVLHHGMNYLVVLPIAALGGPLVGALVDIVVMRRFARSPRLIATVVTLGVAQSLAVVGFFIPIWLGGKATGVPHVQTPWSDFKILNGRGQPLLTGDQIAAVVTVVVLSVGLALFLRYTRIGIALRASAENADRALLLGIPVHAVGTVAWMIAGLLGSMAIYVQAPLIGIPGDATLGIDALLYGLAAAVVARMDRIGVALAAGMGAGVLVFASVAKSGDNNLAAALMLAVILVALFFQRKAMSRSQDTGTSTWEAVKQFRPIPTELRRLPEVSRARIGVYVAAAVLIIGLPYWLATPDLNLLILVPLYGMVAVSLVILTGWAGQISLGQFGLVGVGALVTGGLIADHNIDFFAALLIGTAAGVVVAVIVGLPAVRLTGLYLAVTTLAFGYAMQGFFLNKHYWVGAHLLPDGLTAHIRRPTLYGRINLEDNRTFYFVCVALLLASMGIAHNFRKNRSGRLLLAVRDNQRAATSYAVDVTRTRLAAFAVSGGIAGMSGVLFAYATHNVQPGNFAVTQSIIIFLAVTIGGLTSVPWAVLGATTTEAFILFSPRLNPLLGKDLTAVMPLLLTGPLLIANLYFNPGGLAQKGFDLRDRYLRRVAARHELLVPSLVADRLVVQEDDIHVEEKELVLA
jgi:branched-chain amino acid transport system permease protein